MIAKLSCYDWFQIRREELIQLQDTKDNIAINDLMDNLFIVRNKREKQRI